MLHQQPFTSLNWSHAAVEQGLESFLEAIIFFFFQASRQLAVIYGQP